MRNLTELTVTRALRARLEADHHVSEASCGYSAVCVSLPGSYIEREVRISEADDIRLTVTMGSVTTVADFDFDTDMSELLDHVYNIWFSKEK